MDDFFKALSKIDPFAQFGAQPHQDHAAIITGYEGGSAAAYLKAYERIRGVAPDGWILDCGPGLGENSIACLLSDKERGVSRPVVAVDTWLGNVGDWLSRIMLPPYMHDRLGPYPAMRRFVENVNFNKLGDQMYLLPGSLATMAHLANQWQAKAALICISDLSRFDGERAWQFERLFSTLDDQGIIYGDRIWLSCVDLGNACYRIDTDGFFYLCKSEQVYESLKAALNVGDAADVADRADLKILARRLRRKFRTKPLEEVESTLAKSNVPFFIRPCFERPETGGKFLGAVNLTHNDALVKRISGDIENLNEPRILIARDATVVCDGPLAYGPKVSAIGGGDILINDGEKLIFEGLASAILRPTGQDDVVELNFSGPVYESELPVLFIGGVANFYHWHADHVSTIYYLEEAARLLGISKYRLAVSNVNSIAWECLEMLGYPRDEVIDVTHAALRAPLMISDLRNAAPMLNSFSSRIFDRARDFVLQSSGTQEVDAPEYIYLSRADSNRRRVVNEDALMALLEPLGFKFIRGADLNYREKVKTFSQAKCVVSPHGAGIANTLFTPSGCGVLELFNPGPANNLNGRLLMAKGHLYKYIIFDTPHQGRQDFVVDVDLILRETKSLLAEVHGR